MLYEIDPSDGSIISSVQVTGSDIQNQTQIEGLTSDSNGTLWAIDNKTGTLFTIDPSTGVATTDVTANANGTDLGNAGQTGDGLESLAIDVNRGPIADDDSAEVPEDEMVTIDILDGDFDPDGTIDPTSVMIGTGPKNGTIVVNPDGTVKYTPNPD